MDAPHVTITILDVSLSLVHIPRSRIAELTRPIVKQLLRRSPRFLNLTANEVELSLFVEDDALDEFEVVARKDRQKLRRRELANESAVARRRRRAGLPYPAFHPVEISLDKWRVLQIDSHEDSLSKSGSRVHELSAPLAAAGISILYQSSYLSDFIFVKASRLGAVMELLDAAGFTFYNADPSLFSQNDLNELNRLARLNMEAIGYGLSIQGSPGTMSPAVLSRTRSPSMASLNALSLSLLKKATLEDSVSVLDQRNGESSSSRERTRSKKSMSPASAPVDVLLPDIACVGLNDNAVDIWTLKILTLVGYPELIPIPSSSSAEPVGQYAHDYRMHTLYDPVPNDPRIGIASPDSVHVSPDAAYDSALEDLVPSKQFQKHSARSPSDPEDPALQDSTSSSLSSCSSSDDEDEYFSSPSPYTKRRDGSRSSLVSGLSRTSASSLPDRLDSYLASGRLTQPLTTTATDGTPSATSQAEEASLNPVSNQQRIKAAKKEPHRVPFFSFTRTMEGSSLTTDLRVLSALFSPDERHMVICPNSLLETGDVLNELGASAGEHQARAKDGQSIFDLGDEADLFEMEGEDACAPGLMKCLQIDLHRFGLEKHGLVNRFSGVLDENGINHMYSSTYKTANLLVDKENALRAQHLLRTC